jgi:hypothetical protein
MAAVPPYGEAFSVTRTPCRLASWLTTNRPSCSLSDVGQPVVELDQPGRAHPEPAVLDLDREPVGDRVA